MAKPPVFVCLFVCLCVCVCVCVSDICFLPSFLLIHTHLCLFVSIVSAPLPLPLPCRMRTDKTLAPMANRPRMPVPGASSNRYDDHHFDDDDGDVDRRGTFDSQFPSAERMPLPLPSDTMASKRMPLPPTPAQSNTMTSNVLPATAMGRSPVERHLDGLVWVGGCVLTLTLRLFRWRE